MWIVLCAKDLFQLVILSCYSWMEKKRSEFVVGVIMLNFSDKKYNIIYADPAWHYEISKNYKKTPKTKAHDNGHGLRGVAQNHYETMSLEDICNLPVQQIADKNCYLFLWATSPTLKEALQVMESWGFTYKIVAFVWSKTNRNNNREKLGVGWYTRTNHEFVLLGTKGSLERKSRKVRQWLKAPATIHSKKPNVIRERIIQLYGDVPRIELFARTKIPNWDCWGNDPKLQNKPLEVFS